MSNSWGHTVRLATDDERERYERWNDEALEDGRRPYYRCSARNCDLPVTHHTGYRYVTGRAGRVSSAEKRACEEHARRFAEKHGVGMPTGPSERFTRTGAMAVSELLGGGAA